MGKSLCWVPLLRNNILIMIYLNLTWNIYIIFGYFYSCNDHPHCGSITDALGLKKLMAILSIVSVVYLAAIITIHKKENYMLSPTILALVLDLFGLMYFYVKLIDPYLIETWKTMVDQTIENAPEFRGKLVEQWIIMIIFLIILAIPLIFKIISAVMLRLYRKKLRESFEVLPPFAEVTLHFSAPPSYEECVGKGNISDCPLPPYSKFPI